MASQLLSRLHKLTHSGTAAQSHPSLGSDEADCRMISSEKIELAKAAAAFRLGVRNVTMKSAIQRLRNKLQVVQTPVFHGGEYQARTEMLMKVLQRHKIPLLHFTQCPSLINCQTSTQNGTKFPLEVTLLFDAKCKGPVRVFAICSQLYEDLLAKQLKMEKQADVRTSDEMLKELMDNSLKSSPSFKTAKAIEVKFGQKGRHDTSDCFVAQTCPETGLLCAKSVNATLNDIPGLQRTNGRNKVRDATQEYYMIAIADVEGFGLVHAFSRPVCLITNSSQTWQADAAIFWYDACSLQTLEDEQQRTGIHANEFRLSMTEAKSKPLSTANFKKYINWWFHQLIGSEKPHLTSRPLPEETLEFLARKMLQLDCGQLDGHDTDKCTTCYDVDGSVENFLNGSAVTWSQFYGVRQTPPEDTFSKWFYECCQLICLLETQAAKIKNANANILVDYPEYTPPYNENALGLWDNGLINILAKKQVKLKLVECYANLVNYRVRPALLRVSESILRGLSVVSISDAGRIIGTDPKTPTELEPVSLYLSLCESRFLITHGVCQMYPSIDMNFLRQWIQLQPPKAPGRAAADSKKPTKKKPPYVKATALIDFSAFAKELADNGWLYGDWATAATGLHQQQNVQEFFNTQNGSAGSSGSESSLNGGLHHGNSFSQVIATGNAVGSANIPEMDQGAPWPQHQVYYSTPPAVAVQGFGQVLATAYHSSSNPHPGQGSFDPQGQAPNMQTYGGFEFSQSL